MSLADKIKDVKPMVWTLRPQVLCSPPIPLPMHGLAPRVVLGDKWWDETRQAAYRSTDFHCIACGIRRGERWCSHLEGHEVYEVDGLLGRMTYIETVPICPRCHGFIHQGYLRVKVEEGVITHTEFREIVDHGTDVLRRAGLTTYVPDRYPSVEWSDWRLVIGDKEYRPLYRSYQQYIQEIGK